MINVPKDLLILKINSHFTIEDQDLDKILLSVLKIANNAQIEVTQKHVNKQFDRSQLKPGMRDIGEFDSLHLTSLGRDILMKEEGIYET